MTIKGKIKAISVSKEKGTKKHNVRQAMIKENYGIVGDADPGPWHRQISLLSYEAIEEFDKSRGVDVKAGDFAENFTLEGVDFSLLEIGTRLKISKNIILEVSQIGKDCHTPCHIYKTAGDCIMPKKGVFARVIKGGRLKLEDSVEVLKQ